MKEKEKPIAETELMEEKLDEVTGGAYFTRAPKRPTTCPACGETLPINASYCPGCRYRITFDDAQ